MNFYKCTECEDILIKYGKEGCYTCCNKEMKALVAGEVEASHEKHIPIVNKNGNAYHVSVGEVEHPMTDEHFIEWIVLEFEDGFTMKHLKPGEKPEATFLSEEKVLCAYCYCNLHGLWKKK